MRNETSKPTEARELPSELGQLFKNNSNCYADTHEYNHDTEPPVKVEGEVIQAMTEDVFVKVVGQIIASQQSEITRMKSELEEVSIWIQLNGWQFSTVFASKDSAWINPKTNEVKSFTELYTLYQSQKQKP